MQAILKKSMETKERKDELHLMAAEKVLLSLSSYSRCTECILYAMPFVLDVNGENNLYLRCFETGTLKGFFAKHCKDLFSEIISTHNITKVHIMRIYNDWDVLAFNHHRSESSKGHGPDKNAKMFEKLVNSNKGSIRHSFDRAYQSLKNTFQGFSPGYVVFCERMARHTKKRKRKIDESGELDNINENHQYFKLDGLGNINQWSTAITDYRLNRPFKPYCELQDLVQKFGDLDELSLKDQFEILSSCPNLHKWVVRPDSGGVKLYQYFVPNGRSPRNLILGEMENENVEDGLINIKSIVTMVLAEKYKLLQPLSFKKTNKKASYQRKRVNRETILDQLGATEESFELPMTIKCSLYQEFKRNLYNDGIILWREHNAKCQVVVMNNYDSDTGSFEFNDFVAVTRTVRPGGIINFECSCGTHAALASAVNFSDWDGIKCCHARVFADIIEEFSIDYVQQNEHGYGAPQLMPNSNTESVASVKISNGLKSVIQDVIPLHSVMDIEKFSVRSPVGHQFIHVYTDNRSKRVYVKCMSGLCSLANSKKIKLRTMEEVDKLCPHLLVFKSYIDENWDKHRLLRLLRTQLDTDTDTDDEQQLDDVTDPDFDAALAVLHLDDTPGDVTDNSENKVIDGFDPETLTWKFHSKFGRIVNADPFDENLITSTIKRTEFFLMALNNQPVEFHPRCDSDQCACEVPWMRNSEGQLVYVPDGKTTLYTRDRTIDCDLFKLVCSTGKCCLRWDGLFENIFRISQQICIVEELCWEYIDMVCTSKTTFASFRQCIDNNYKRHRSPKYFMSAKTFLKLFFSWASHQPRDLNRQCNWCGESPQVLACDATKIGILSQNIDINPIEACESRQVLPTETRRNNRCFLAFSPKSKDESDEQYKNRLRTIRDSRNYLKTWTSNSTEDKLTPLEHLDCRKQLLSVLPQKVKPFFSRYINQQMSIVQLKAAKRVMHLLSFDAPVRAFLPKQLVPIMETMVMEKHARTGLLRECQKFNIALSNLLAAFNDRFLDSDVLSLIEYLLERVRSVPEPDIPPCEVIPNDPSKSGRFYYFRKDGAQIRKNRNFEIGKGKIHDDEPTTSSCSKRYPIVAPRGTSFLFLWFCPAHGFCYGGHIVNGSEGRKDAACSLFQFLETAPEGLFYDFACGFEEYSLNRESGYFSNTRFFHDLFHRYGHNCSPMYSTKSLIGMTYNTSICEQFNSFLQCVKASCKHMSQEHFVFYVKFFIDIWNTKKKKQVLRKNKLRVALAGSK
ncbi:uncharacterized protein [Clytia hemisphaerica]